MLKSLTNRQTYYNQSINEIEAKFETDLLNGLKGSQIQERLDLYGFNELPKVQKSLWKIYLAPLFNFLILILLVSGIVIVILGSPGETIITFVVVFINSLTAIFQQFRAQKALESLRMIAALKSIVIREGKQIEIPSREIVPGDIILLSQGSKVPADGRIVDEMNLTIDEAPLTGESQPIEKISEVLTDVNIPIQKRKNIVFMGTYVYTGRAKVLVTSIGENTEIGKISSSLNEMGTIEDIPLTKKLNRLGYILGVIVIISLTILIIYKLTLLDIQNIFTLPNINTALTNSILRAMNVLPVNLPLLVTLVLLTGVLNMAQSGVIIKNLSAIESLGRVSVICSDKTGTITKNEMTVEKFWINEKEYSVTGTGYEPEGKIYNNNKILKNHSPTLERFVDSIVVNNNAKLVYEDVKVHVGKEREKAIRKALGSPTEAALLVLSEKAEYIPFDIRKKYSIITEFSFDSKIKRMTTICKLDNDINKIIAYSKGAPERIIPICSKIETSGIVNEFTNPQKDNINNLVKIKAEEGYRTLAIAYKEINNFNDEKREDIEKSLIFLGFVSILDPPRKGVKEAVNQCQAGSIKVVMITGDHPNTAKTIAKQMEIFKEGDLVTEGNGIANLSEVNFEKTSVFARVEPSDKEIIVDRYQKNKRIVAMTGDGINDSLALKKADAGIALGITGTDVAKETADMVITDDNFVSIEKGVRIGRGLFAKIRIIIYFFICLNIMEATIFFGYEFIPTFTLFSSNWQHFYIFGVVHSLPSLALVIDTQPKDIMKDPPRNKQEILNKNMWIMLLIQAFLMGLGLVLVLELTRNQIIPLNGWNTNPILSYIPAGSSLQDLINQKSRTMFITTIYILETNFIWSFRRPNKSIIKSFKEEVSRTLLGVCIFTLSLHILVIMFSYGFNYAINDVLGLNFQLNFMFLSLTDWLICVLFALPGIFGIEIFKFYARKKHIYF
ncbi:MAG: cation-translocating P-type ATPase [Candidatus Lokiarchaeota archaeon]